MEQSLFYNNVTLLDFAYLDRKFRVYGESYRVDVELVGKLDDEAMILDFSQVKSMIKGIIDFECDHRLIVSKDLVRVENQIGIIDREALFYEAPMEAFCLVPFDMVSTREMAVHLESLLLKKMPKNVSAVRVELSKNEENHTTFQYTHGLKRHKGNCQRLLHGHRSTFEIYIDGERDIELEKKFRKQFLRASVHFAYSDNIDTAVSAMKFQTEIPMVNICYNSSQGKFNLKIPGRDVFVVEDETTIENIAKSFCNLVFRIVDKKCTITFKITEGIGKGGKVTLSAPL